ncbi:MAG: hypothetical protein P1V35_05060 [Planctomycetota bacterium]|nr:hypothetical protein [Planctomycetota bacterium]
MTETIVQGAFFAQLHLMFDWKDEGPDALAVAGVERRQQLFQFLNNDLAKGDSAAHLKNFLCTDRVFRASSPARVLAGVVASDGLSILPLMTGTDSVRGLVDEGVQSLSGFIGAGYTRAGVSPPWAGLSVQYTCKQLVWDPKKMKWVWEYNYNMAEFGSSRLSGAEISARFLAAIATAPNPPSQAELVELRKIQPNYRLACSLERDESVGA